MVTSAGSPSGSPAAFSRALTWVISLVPSGTLTCAIVTASRCSIAENNVTLSFSPVQAPRITLPSSAISSPPSGTFPCLRENPSAGYPVKLGRVDPGEHAFQLVFASSGRDHLNLNQSHFAPSFLSSARGMSAALLAISR